MTEQASILIKRYGGRRLYEPDGGRYVTADELRLSSLEGIRFVVRDAMTGEDVTSAVLTEPGVRH